MTDFAWVDDAAEQFISFCPVTTYVNHGDMTVVSNRPVPTRFTHMPLFRAAVRNLSTGKSTWWLWDGKKEIYVGDLNNETINLPIRQLIDFQELKIRISTSWTSSQDI
jgi:hypothetical protein